MQYVGKMLSKIKNEYFEKYAGIDTLPWVIHKCLMEWFELLLQSTRLFNYGGTHLFSVLTNNRDPNGTQTRLCVCVCVCVCVCLSVLCLSIVLHSFCLRGCLVVRVCVCVSQTKHFHKRLKKK